MGKKWEKRWMAVCLAALSVMAAVPVYASDMKEQSMDLTMSKASEYTMTIPSSQSITFGKENTEIGTISVTGNIGTKQQVKVTVDKTDFVDAKDETNRFSFDLRSDGQTFTEAVWTSEQVRAQEATAYLLTAYIPTATWNSTIAGNYSATITFQAELQDVE